VELTLDVSLLPDWWFGHGLCTIGIGKLLCLAHVHR